MNESELARALAESRSCVVLTGAGISAESGIPTFRDAQWGLWAEFDPGKLATPEAFARDPELVSRWYDERRLAVAGARPNAGHFALARIERFLEERGRRFLLVTQNVDRLHQRAGSRSVVELHGSLLDWRCSQCGAEREESGPAFPCYPPRCACGGARRPGVVWFGEMLPQDSVARAEGAVNDCDLFFSIGTSAEVFPAAGLIHRAVDLGARTVEINPQPTPVSRRVDLSIHEAAATALRRLADELEPRPTKY